MTTDSSHAGRVVGRSHFAGVGVLGYFKPVPRHFGQFLSYPSLCLLLTVFRAFTILSTFQQRHGVFLAQYSFIAFNPLFKTDSFPPCETQVVPLVRGLCESRNRQPRPKEGMSLGFSTRA